MLFEIIFNDYEEEWTAYKVDWDDESRVLEAVGIDTYGIEIGSLDVQTDYSVFIDRDTVGDAFYIGAKLISEEISKIRGYNE
jgi:hypothetical protein